MVKKIIWAMQYADVKTLKIVYGVLVRMVGVEKTVERRG